MAQRFQLEYDDFGGGLNLRYAAHLIQKNEAQVAQNVDLQDRAIKGLKDWSSSVATFASPYKFLWYSPAATFVGASYANETRFALNDGPRVYATIGGQRPYVLTPGQSYSLGIVPPANVAYTASSVAGGKTGTYRYGITFVTADGLESNPQDFDLVISFVSGGAPFAGKLNFDSLPVSAEARVVARRIYRSLSNSDAMYFLAEVSDNTTTTFMDDLPDGALDLTRPLTWNDGGYPSSGGVYVEDHSIPPALAILSTGVHSASGTVSGRAGSGVVFGAIGSTVYWSMLGFPDYWPTANQFAMPENVESIAAMGGSTFVFTPNFIYQARGDSDDTMSWSRSNTPYGVKKGFGRFTTATTKGILFFGQDGLAVFDGSDARLVAEQKLPRTYYNSRTINAVGFFDNRFYVFCADGTVIYDFRDGIANPVVTTSTHVANAATVANYSEPVTADKLADLPKSVLDLSVTVPGSYKVYTASGPTTYAVSAAIAAPPSGTTATAKLQFGYDRVVVASGGSGYTSVPTVTFAAPAGGGRPAKGVATISGGALISITITDSGDGYSESEIIANNITLSGGAGSGATFNYYAKITGAQMTNPGTGYTSAPKVTITGTSDVAGQMYASLLPLVYQDAALVYAGGNLFRMGGVFFSSPNPTTTLSNTIDKYDASSRNWTRLALATVDLGGPVRGVACDTDGTTAYLAGGTNSASSVGATSSAYLTWNGSAFTAGTSLPSVRAFGSLTKLSSGTVYHIGGYDGSGVPASTVYKLVGGVWSSMTMAVGGVTYYLARHAAVLIGTKIYLFGGIVKKGFAASPTLNDLIFIWDTSTDGFSIDSDATVYGWTGRHSLQAVGYNGKAYVYGGIASMDADNTSTVLSDLWVYDPSASPAWQCRTGEIINAYARARAGYVVDSTNGIMYTVGGITTYAVSTSDALSIPLAQASDCSGTPGLYVMDTSGAVRRFEGGSRMSDWVWQGRDEVGPKPGPKMTWVRARAAVVDSVKIGATVYEGTGGAQTWPTFATSAIGTALGSQVRFWFPSVQASPSNMVVRGQRISLKLGAANSSTTAEVHRVEIDAKMDTDGQG